MWLFVFNVFFRFVGFFGRFGLGMSLFLPLLVNRSLLRETDLRGGGGRIGL